MSSSTLPLLSPPFPQLLKWKSVKEDQAAIEKARRELGPNADPRLVLYRASQIKASTIHVHDWRGIDNGRVCASCGKVEEEPKDVAAAWYVLQATLAQKEANRG
jgi:hypothetical protein